VGGAPMGGWRILLLGLGQQGRAALWDLAGDERVARIRAADAGPDRSGSAERWGRGKAVPLPLDGEDRASIRREMEQADGVVELLPGRFALPVAELAAEVGVPLVTSMYLHDPGERDPGRRRSREERIRALDDRAARTGATILPEFGMDPGIDLILCREALRGFEEVAALYSYGAGFPEPEAAGNPLGYKFTWSIPGVMRSYLRPARIVREGELAEIPAEAIFDPENRHELRLPETGWRLECFPNGDVSAYRERLGLERVRAFGRYVCRWPGHGAFWRVMARCGFLEDRPVRVGDVEVVPQEFCGAVMAGRPEFAYGEGERDLALVRAEVRGTLGGRPATRALQILDRRDLETGFTAMQRTVGFTAAVGLRLILEGRLPGPGLRGPEEVPFGPFAEALAERGMAVVRTEAPWDGRLEPGGSDGARPREEGRR